MEKLIHQGKSDIADVIYQYTLLERYFKSKEAKNVQRRIFVM